MSETVLDASAILAAVLKEPGGSRVGELTGPIIVSAVNYAEVCTRLIDVGVARAAAEASIALLGLEVVAFDVTQAEGSAELRAATRAAGLSLGDRACLALAASRDAIALTADTAWRRVDVPVAIEFMR